MLTACLTIDSEVPKWFIVRCRGVCSWHQILDLVVRRWDWLFYSTYLLWNSTILCKYSWKTLCTYILLLVDLSLAPRLLAVLDKLLFKHFIEGLIQKLSSILLVTFTSGGRWLALFALLRMKFARCTFFKGNHTARYRFLRKTALVCKFVEAPPRWLSHNLSSGSVESASLASLALTGGSALLGRFHLQS